MVVSVIEEEFALQLRACKLPAAEREYRFHPVRMWRFDFAWPTARVAVECEGGTWGHGRHTRGSGFAADVEKYNTAAERGWCVLRFTGDMVKERRRPANAGRRAQSRAGLDSMNPTWSTMVAQYLLWKDARPVRQRAGRFF